MPQSKALVVPFIASRMKGGKLVPRCQGCLGAEECGELCLRLLSGSTLKNIKGPDSVLVMAHLHVNARVFYNQQNESPKFALS